MKIRFVAITALLMATAGAVFMMACGGGDIPRVASGGNVQGNSAKELALAKQARQEMCCSITIVQYSETAAKANGCGQQGSYTYVGNAWVLQSLTPVTGWGSAADRLPNCNQ